MRFPLVLDMNKYVDDPGQAEGGVARGTAGVGGAPGGVVRERSDFQVRKDERWLTPGWVHYFLSSHLF